MKTCQNCKFYTGIQCHEHGYYWGQCKKNKNTLTCYDNTEFMNNYKLPNIEIPKIKL